MHKRILADIASHPALYLFTFAGVALIVAGAINVFAP